MHNHSPCLFCQYLLTEVKGVTNIWHLIGRLNQPAADGFLPLRAFKPSSSDSADRGRSIIRVTGPHVCQTFLNDVFTFLTEVGNAGRIVNTGTSSVNSEFVTALNTWYFICFW